MKYKNTLKLLNITCSSETGFAHLVIPIVVVAVIVTGAGFVVASHHKAADTTNLATTKSSISNTAATKDQTNTKVTTLTPVSPAATSTQKSATPSTKAQPTISSPTVTPTQPVTSQPAAVTPLSALTTLISNIDKGQPAQVTAQSVTVAGPITDAKARPLVFTANGQTYFAYTQGSKPNFNTTASQTASSMAIISAPSGSVVQLQAHLDKSGNLVDENLVAVGYSTGGN